ncbi:RteC domain-containing protein [Myroides sp. M-43]|uniref:RteC domain-containing protein n=1 Tax=Myroides oncorhynchi TaxID=2893756 RepID=UPI001E36B4D1|nr:RteC domain-containing protein [Myroides oncorhynchi]MCC9043574.1 RteC domain-containing protein [Myroides oncorhynchi]
MNKNSIQAIQDSILKEESKLTLIPGLIISEAKHMTEYLHGILISLKQKVSSEGFSSEQQEIHFFKHFKPSVLSKLIYYNNIYRIESYCLKIPLEIQKGYYLKKLKQLTTEYKHCYTNSDFFRYYKSQRTDKDAEYFTRGNIDILQGVNSIAFEIDPLFSNYYDYKLSRLLSNQMLYEYLNKRINQITSLSIENNSNNNISIVWSESNTAIVELIYALYASKSINQGDLEIRKIAYIFQNYFNIPLSDVHHVFHRMKTRSYSRTIFLDRLKESLENYMDKEY